MIPDSVLYLLEMDKQRNIEKQQQIAAEKKAKEEAAEKKRKEKEAMEPTDSGNFSLPV